MDMRELDRVEPVAELSLAELDAEEMMQLPSRLQMRHHRFFFRRRSHFVRHERFFHRRFDHRFGFNRFGGSRFGGFGFGGSAFNSNATFQSNFNPQIAIGGFGGTFISSHNTNFNATNQFASPISFGF